MPTLMGTKLYKQRDTQWSKLTPDFANKGCAVCCAATIASYKEHATVTPKTLQQRGVFNTSTAYVQNWSAVSNLFNFHTKEHDHNLAGALREVKNQIDTYRDPVLLVISGSYEHYVVAIGYTNNCTSASDVKIRDPYYGCRTLGDVMNYWPTFERMNRII